MHATHVIFASLFVTGIRGDLLPNSCRDLEDGLHWLQLAEGENFPPVHLQCSNGYAILDYTQDSNIKEYFTSWTKWHISTSGPTNEYSINWQDWYIPDTTLNPVSSFNFESNAAFRNPQFATNLQKDDRDTITGVADPTEQTQFLTGPESSVMNYLISPDCNSCDEDSTRQLYGSSTTYWMTGTIFGCFWSVKGAHNCDVDWDTDTCYTCLDKTSSTQLKAIKNGGNSLIDQGQTRVAISDESSIDEFDKTGICPHNVRSSNQYVPLTHDGCSHDEGTNKLHLKPSLGTNGKYCVCVQPKSGFGEYFEVENMPKESKSVKTLAQRRKLGEENENESESESKSEINIIPFKKSEEQAEAEDTTIYENNIDDEDTMKVHQLTQGDFDRGTYRIRRPGKYVLMQDILFDFNNKVGEPNGAGAYWPDEDTEDEYPGASGGRDPFFLGFFAGITIECEDVILDLNGHSLEMSDWFYYQQRWFTTIELSTQYFLPGQGIGNFGATPKVASNVIIRNGVLGLTSHHGIHGNYNKNIQLRNLVVRDFETHGIQFNGFDTIVLDDVEVGPTSSKAFFNGEYGHMRALLPRFRAVAQEIGDDEEPIKFYGRDRPTSMREITGEIQQQLDMAFAYVVHGKKYSPENSSPAVYESYKSMLKLFINEDGIPNGGAQYGIFLNTFGASVFTYNLYTGFYSTNAILNNVRIHDMSHEMQEYVRIFRPHSGDIIINPFNAPLNAEELFVDITDKNNEHGGFMYKGNIVLDAYIAMNYYSDNWDYLQMQLLMNNFLTTWAIGDDTSTVTKNTVNFGCNSDVMIHSGKGINGLRLDGVQNVQIKDLSIYNLYDSTPIGSELCGEYDDLSCASCANDGGHFRQTQPMQIGFTGNMNQAININAAIDVTIENINIDTIESKTGPAFGISIWPACDVTLKGDINVKNIKSGTGIENGRYSYEDRPNKAPETCAVRVYWEYGDYTTSVDYSEANIASECLTGHVACLGNDFNDDGVTMLGSANMECSNKEENTVRSESKAIKLFGIDNDFLNGMQHWYIIALIIIISFVTIYFIVALLLTKCCNFNITITRLLGVNVNKFIVGRKYRKYNDVTNIDYVHLNKSAKRNAYGAITESSVLWGEL